MRVNMEPIVYERRKGLMYYKSRNRTFKKKEDATKNKSKWIEMS